MQMESDVVQTTKLTGSDLEDEVRAYLRTQMPLDRAPAQLRLAFHDAGTYDVGTHSGGAHGAIHLLEELKRSENSAMTVCVDLLARAKATYPSLSWADLVALGGAAAVEKCGGPTIRVGLGRVDAAEPAPEHRLPTSDDGPTQLRALFDRLGLGPRELVALSGAHTLGFAHGRSFTRDPFAFSNAYFRALLESADDPALGLLSSDRALLAEPELRELVEEYAADEAVFLAAFADAYRRLTWLGKDDPVDITQS
jgi:L-ascorbate peroxidase